jgi:hypothetical protein
MMELKARPPRGLAFTALFCRREAGAKFKEPRSTAGGVVD